MARVFPIDEWSVDQPSHAFNHDDIIATDGSFEIAMAAKGRARQASLPLSAASDIASSFQSMTLKGHGGPSYSPREDVKKERGIRGLLRRASVSIKAKTQRRHSHAVESRPSTSYAPWLNRLRGAASFNRHSVFPSDYDYETAVDSCTEIMSPIPGYGDAPPIIPIGSGGAAARATAAAQNEYFVRHRQFLSADERFGDHESGIGIAMSPSEPAPSYPDPAISRVDFISLLPAELSIQILAHVDHVTLYNTALVSKSWARVSRSQHVWREAFLREKSKTYAMSMPVQPGTMLGVPPTRPSNDWKELYRARQELEDNWRHGRAEPVYLNGHLDSIYCVQFDEFKIITGSRDKTIRVWDMKRYTCSLIIGPPDVIQSSALMTALDGTPHHYSTLPDQSRQIQYNPEAVSFPIHHNKSILCLQYDENILVTGSSDSTCIVYDIKNGYEPIRRLQHHTAAVLDLAFDERYIVTCSKDVSICVWDRETGNLLKQLRGHTGPVNAVQMRGNTIVSCSGDFTVKLWNIDTGKNIREFAGHTKGLACSQFSDDSRFIASAGNDKIIRIWDANTGECLQKIAAHENLVRSLHIDSVSGRLISGSYDQDIKVFEMETGRLLLDFPKWHSSWVLGAKSDYRRIVSTGQDPKILIMDFGLNIEGIDMLESK